MTDKNEILKEFYDLAEYEGKNEKEIKRYKNDISLFLLYARHVLSYELVSGYLEGKCVLDIGCYLGYGEKHVSSVAQRVVAIDRDEAAITYARNRNKSEKVEFKIADARGLAFPDESFDVVLAFQLIEHIPPKDIDGLLKDIRRVLKKNGMLIMSTPNRKFRLWKYQLPFNLDHYQEFTKDCLFDIAKMSFKEIKIRGIAASRKIQDIEKERVSMNLWTRFLVTPVFRTLGKFFPRQLTSIVRASKRMASNFRGKKRSSSGISNFNREFESFSPDEFYLEDRDPEDSLELVAFCNN